MKTSHEKINLDNKRKKIEPAWLIIVICLTLCTAIFATSWYFGHSESGVPTGLSTVILVAFLITPKLTGSKIRRHSEIQYSDD